ncbi:MAG: phosphatase PAP2 family protein, partial [Spirochaetales bacterium]
MNIQYQIMYFFSSIHNTVMDALANFFTFLGEEYAIIGIAMLIFWCIDKRKGFASFFAMIFATNIMNIIKVIVRFPRPWMVLEDLHIVRKETATGYSFPSGHTTMSVSFYGSIAKSFKSKVVRIICIALITIIAFLRVYLCVHWPTDVLGGLAIGIPCAILLTRYAMSFQDNVYRDAKKMMFVATLMTIAGLVVAILCQNGTFNSEMVSDLYIGLAISGGVLFFSTLEQTTIAFKV